MKFIFLFFLFFNFNARAVTWEDFPPSEITLPELVHEESLAQKIKFKLHELRMAISDIFTKIKDKKFQIQPTHQLKGEKVVIEKNLFLHELKYSLAMNSMPSPFPERFKHLQAAYAFPDEFANDPAWRPQGVAFGHHQGAGYLFVVWYHRKEISKGEYSLEDGPLGLRLSIVNLSDMNAPKMAMVQLAHMETKPNGTSKKFPVFGHGGGAAVVDHWLYVTHREYGLVRFNLDTFMQVKADKEKSHSVLLPVEKIFELTRYSRPKIYFDYLEPGHFQTGVPAYLFSGNFDDRPFHSKFYALSLDKQSGIPSLDLDLGQKLNANRKSWHHIQGIFVKNENEIFSSIQLEGNRACLLAWNVSKDEVVLSALPAGAEDLAFDPANNLLWGVTEFESRRIIFGHKL